MLINLTKDELEVIKYLLEESGTLTHFRKFIANKDTHVAVKVLDALERINCENQKTK